MGNEEQPTTLAQNGAFRGPITLKEKCDSVRSLMLSWEKAVIELKQCPELSEPATPATNPGEAIANIMLAYRHMEDARMRIGKVIQAMDGGVSVYDKPKA